MMRASVAVSGEGRDDRLHDLPWSLIGRIPPHRHVAPAPPAAALAANPAQLAGWTELLRPGKRSTVRRRWSSLPVRKPMPWAVLRDDLRPR